MEWKRRTNALDLLLEAAVLLGERGPAETLALRLSGLGPLATSWLDSTCIARHLDGATVLLGDYEKARELYQQAVDVSKTIRNTRIALTRFQLAGLLLEHYPKERTEALGHLDIAIGEFQDMKRQPSLERVLRHRDILMP